MEDEVEMTRNAPESTGSIGNITQGQLTHLSDWSDYKIADGEPDIHGWDVRGTNGEKVGDVEDVLVDSVTRRVRYIEIKLEKDLAANVERRHALLPIGAVRLDEHDKNVHVNLESERLRSLPKYVRGDLSPAYEQSVVNIFRRADEATIALGVDPDAYEPVTQTLRD
jgi:sporulation protein YlmC with PRC-barrel domain